MTLPEFKAWVLQLKAASPAMSQQLLNQNIMDKLDAECYTSVLNPKGLIKQWTNRSDRTPMDDYIMGPFGPEQPL